MHSTWSNWPGPPRKPVAPKQEQTGLGSGKRSWKTSYTAPQFFAGSTRETLIRVRWPLTYRLFPGFPSSSPAHRRTAAARRPALRDAVRDTSPRCRRRTRDSPSGWDRPPVACRASRMPLGLPCSHHRDAVDFNRAASRVVVCDLHGSLHSRIEERIPARTRRDKAVRRG